MTSLTDKHVAIRRVGNGEQMWRHLGSTFALVPVDDVRSIDGQPTVRVDDHTEETRVCLPHSDIKTIHFRVILVINFIRFHLFTDVSSTS